MPYTPNSIPQDHTEFGGGPGLIDPLLRQERVVTAEDELREIYATNPHAAESDPNFKPETADLYDRPWASPEAE